MVLVIDLCQQGFCTNEATVYVQPLVGTSLREHRPKLCAEHAKEFRVKAAARHIVEGEQFALVPLCS